MLKPKWLSLNVCEKRRIGGQGALNNLLNVFLKPKLLLKPKK